MIHLRQYNERERMNARFLVDNRVEFAVLQVTETGLRKSILDATAPVREYLRESGVHDYAAQGQGTMHKRLVDTFILTESSCHKTKTSLYRPITKKGDPRLWVGKTAGVEFLHAGDIFALIAHKRRLYVINMTTVDMREAYCSPLWDLIREISAARSDASEELLGMIRGTMTEWRPAEVMADTGIGRTIETILGIPMNASKEPDYKGIELKSHRISSGVRGALFTQAPDWSISRYKSGKEIVGKYGYIPQGLQAKTLQVTMTANKPNQQGLGLLVNQTEGILEADEYCLRPSEDGSFRKVQDVAAWKLPKLHERLLTKHRETFWIDVETKLEGGREYFRCSAIEHTKSPVIRQFDTLIEQGDIQVDLMLSRPSGHGDTYSFKIKTKARGLLFPKAERYSLTAE